MELADNFERLYRAHLDAKEIFQRRFEFSRTLQSERGENEFWHAVFSYPINFVKSYRGKLAY